MTIKKETTNSQGAVRFIVLAVLIAGAFLGAYQFAQARDASAGAQVASAYGTPGIDPAAGQPAGGCALGADPAAGQTTDGAASAGGCCGSSAATEGGVTGEQVQGEATVTGDVQTIDVDLSQGYYDPNVIVLKAGVPAQITFGQSGGCTGQVISSDLNFYEDVTTGPKTVSLPALEAGEYAFSCGMEMVFGKIVVK